MGARAQTLPVVGYQPQGMAGGLVVGRLEEVSIHAMARGDR